MNASTNFNTLSLSDKYQYISDNGKYIGVRNYYNYAINLYLVEDQLFELWYFRPDNKIEKIECLTDLSKLDLYINHMASIESKSNLQ